MADNPFALDRLVHDHAHRLRRLIGERRRCVQMGSRIDADAEPVD